VTSTNLEFRIRVVQEGQDFQENQVRLADQVRLVDLVLQPAPEGQAGQILGHQSRHGIPVRPVARADPLVHAGQVNLRTEKH